MQCSKKCFAPALIPNWFVLKSLDSIYFFAMIHVISYQLQVLEQLVQFLQHPFKRMSHSNEHDESVHWKYLAINWSAGVIR